jgi:hypothetical protein
MTLRGRLLLAVVAGAGSFLAYAIYAVATLMGWGARMRVAVSPGADRHFHVGMTIMVGMEVFRVGRIGSGELWVSRPLWWRAWRWLRWRR